MRYFKHSDDEECIMWLDTNCTEQAAASVKPRKSQAIVIDREKLYGLIPVVGNIEKQELLARAKEIFNCGKDPIGDALIILQSDGRISSVVLPKELDENGKAKRGAHREAWTRSQPSLN